MGNLKKYIKIQFSTSNFRLQIQIYNLDIQIRYRENQVLKKYFKKRNRDNLLDIDLYNWFTENQYAQLSTTYCRIVIQEQMLSLQCILLLLHNKLLLLFFQLITSFHTSCRYKNKLRFTATSFQSRQSKICSFLISSIIFTHTDNLLHL